MQERFKCFNVNFRLLKTIYVHLLVCYLSKCVTFTVIDTAVEHESLNSFGYGVEGLILERRISE